jgi:hypothetical protein
MHVAISAERGNAAIVAFTPLRRRSAAVFGRRHANMAGEGAAQCVGVGPAELYIFVNCPRRLIRDTARQRFGSAIRVIGTSG